MRRDSERATTRRTVARATALRVMGLRVLYAPAGEWEGRFLPLVGRDVRLGRAPLQPPNLSVPDTAMSREHARVTPAQREGEHVVIDADSTNGTFVNGRRVRQATLAPNDVVRMGDTIFLYRAATDEPDGSVPAVPASPLLGQSRAIQEAVQAIERIAPSHATVLVLGETGTGKDLVASELHARSGRSGLFVAVNCAALPGRVIESELFGHMRGAFTGATQPAPGLFREASGGTLLLDEIGELSPELQAHLLRALESGEVRPVGSARPVRVDVRFVAATNVDIAAAVERGTFRGDVLARLDQARIVLPPLRDRREDVLLLLRHFLSQESGGRRPPAIDADAAESLLVHPWRFNVREVQNLARGLMLQHPDLAAVTRDRLPAELREPPVAAVDASGAGATGGVGETAAPCEPIEAVLERVSASVLPDEADVRRALLHFHGRISDLAQQTGRDRRQVYRWAQRYQLNLAAFRV